MSIDLLDDEEMLAGDETLAGRYVAGLCKGGVTNLIANSASRPMLLRHQNRSIPLTVDENGFGKSYVASPHSAYVLYAREEMDIVGMRKGRRAAHLALHLLDKFLRAARINRAVHLDNWLLSTNLHGDWKGEGLSESRAFLAQRFPDHFLILRSLDSWSCPALLRAAQADGWIILPARQIWVVDDMARDWRPRNDYGNDRRALRRSGLTVEDLQSIAPADQARIADLYHMLYVQRYSGLNPIFTRQFIALTQQTGLLSYRVARDQTGQIMAVAGMLARNGIMTPPVVGYDISRPKSDALYRIACFLFSERAMERGWALHGSSGAAHFKRMRGAHGVTEYMAIHAGHLSVRRRAVVKGLAHLLERVAVPMMQREAW